MGIRFCLESHLKIGIGVIQLNNYGDLFVWYNIIKNILFDCISVIIKLY